MSNMQKAIPKEQFTVCIEDPNRLKNGMYVNIHENGSFRLNEKLKAVLGGKELDIRFTADYQHLLLAIGEGIRFPKNGSCKLEECSKGLAVSRIKLPARCFVWKPEQADFWQGDLMENPTIKPSGGRHSSKKN